MKVDPEKLKNLIDTLSDDQKQLLREGLANGHNLDPCTLADVFHSVENQRLLSKLTLDAEVEKSLLEEIALLPPDKPLTRW
jgi:hypothetical protein